MAEQQDVLTSIRDSTSEGFVASTLFSQGWNVLFRALDYESLKAHIGTQDSQNATLLISVDSEGLTQSGITELRESVKTLILLHTTPENKSDFPEAIPLPETALGLIALMRGSIRSPMIRTQGTHSVTRSAKTIAVGGISGGLGCTTLAVNLSIELAALEKRTLLVDAHAYAPSIFRLLGQRGLNAPQEFSKVSQYLWASEITQENVVSEIERLDRASNEFDFIVLDLGVIYDFASQLSGRRWSGQALMWVSTYADSLMVLGPSDRVGLERLQNFAGELKRNAIKPPLTFLHVLRQQGKREPVNAERFLKIITPLRPEKICEFPFDPRSVLKAEVEESSLMESNERGIVRKVIAEIAGQFTS